METLFPYDFLSDLASFWPRITHNTSLYSYNFGTIPNGSIFGRFVQPSFRPKMKEKNRNRNASESYGSKGRSIYYHEGTCHFCFPNFPPQSIDIPCIRSPVFPLISDLFFSFYHLSKNFFKHTEKNSMLW